MACSARRFARSRSIWASCRRGNCRRQSRPKKYQRRGMDPGPSEAHRWSNRRAAVGLFATRGGTTMSAEEHKALVLRFVDEFWSGGNLAAADELMAPDAVVHEPVAGTLADLKAVARAIKAAFPDWHSTVEEMI